MLVAIQCHYMDEHVWDISLKFAFCGQKNTKEGHTPLEQHMGEKIMT